MPSEPVIDKLSLSSEEGTTQGNPLAMYALGIVPMIYQLKDEVLDGSRVCYADNATAAGKSCLYIWWDTLTELRAQFGYNTNTSKMRLIAKKSAEAQACNLFSNTLVNITSDGRPYLGAALSSFYDY